MVTIYRHELRITDTAMDANGHANNVEFIRWMQEAAVRHWESAGCSRAIKEINATWVVRSHHIEYHRPGYAGDQVTVLTWVADLRRASSLRKYKVVRANDGAVLARGETDWVFVDATTGRPRVIPELLRKAFELVGPEQEP